MAREGCAVVVVVALGPLVLCWSYGRCFVDFCIWVVVFVCFGGFCALCWVYIGYAGNIIQLN